MRRTANKRASSPAANIHSRWFRARESAAGGAVTIAFKEYGIRLNFIPTITPRGTIRLQVAPEVSALDFGDAVTISGFMEPAITVRRVKTEIELGDRQSFAIGGLLDNTENETFQKIPFLGDIPILGKFFQSIQRTKNNTELIVIVTPEIVSPVAGRHRYRHAKVHTTISPAEFEYADAHAGYSGRSARQRRQRCLWSS